MQSKIYTYLIYYYLFVKLFLNKIFYKKIRFFSFEETIHILKSEKKSFARYGDGEIRMVLSALESIGFQKDSERLSRRLNEVLQSQLPNLLIGLPNTFRYLLKNTMNSQTFWYGFNLLYAKDFLNVINLDKKYGDSLITRFYMMYKDKAEKTILPKIHLLKTLWNEQDILFVEGADTKLGIGNDLFENAKSIQRIICPSENAFEQYENILQQTKKYGHDKLIIIALGPTATVLAYDLAKNNFWALDLGHIDIEYMWFLQKSKKKEAVTGKYVNESGSRGNVIAKGISGEYQNQIISVI